MRRSMAIAHLVVLAVLLGGVQHALRLCTTGALAHAASAAASESAASAHPPCHSESRDEDGPAAPEAPPACCGPLAAVVSIPSGDARATLVAGGTSLPALVPQLERAADFGGDAAPRQVLTWMRSHPPSPRLRPHLVFESLLV